MTGEKNPGCLGWSYVVLAPTHPQGPSSSQD